MPRTVEERDRCLHQPAFCELLPVRDIMHRIIIRTTGAFVAGYELSGMNSYYHSDEGRNGTKMALEALIRSLPERSMRMQVRFEIAEGLGDLPEDCQRQLRNQPPTRLALDRTRLERWRSQARSPFYLRPRLHAYLHWNPMVHHERAGNGLARAARQFSISPSKCIQRTRGSTRTLCRNSPRSVVQSALSPSIASQAGGKPSVVTACATTACKQPGRSSGKRRRRRASSPR
jgi:hypothetical protein